MSDAARCRRWGEVIGGLRAGIAALSDIDRAGLPQPMALSLADLGRTARAIHWNAVRLEAIEREHERKAEKRAKRRPRTRRTK